jgi:5'(3')-deoxyribonucleotidase
MQVNTIICTNKSLLKGNYLVDDQIEHGQKEFEGKHLHFGSESFKDWNDIKYYLLDNYKFKKVERNFYGC